MEDICKNCKYFYSKLYNYDDYFIQEMTLCKSYFKRVNPNDKACKKFKDISSSKS